MGELPTFLTLDEAARRFHLSLETLTHLVETDRLQAARVDGRIIVAEEDIRKVIEGNHNLLVFIPLEEAIRRFPIKAERLIELAKAGKVRAAKVNGEIAVAEVDVKTAAGVRRHELWSRVKHLDGVPIGLEEACAKYKVSSSSVYRWIRLGYVRVLNDRRKGGRGCKRLLNEADVAYAALVAQERGERRRKGSRILTIEFAPPHCVPQPA